jgi:hypothetical protein
VRYFRDQFLAGEKCDPIEVDNHCEGGHIYGPIVTDGHHRLCGAVLAKRTTIDADYGGRLDILRYLIGKRRACPPI